MSSDHVFLCEVCSSCLLEKVFKRIFAHSQMALTLNTSEVTIRISLRTINKEMQKYIVPVQSETPYHLTKCATVNLA